MTTIKNWFHAVTNWLLLSSANPTQASLTFKGVLLGLVPTVMMVSGFTHLALNQDLLSTSINDAATVVQDVLFIVAGAMTLYGALRKLFLGVLTLWTALRG